MWRLLVHPWLSLVTLMLALILALALLLLPQIPAQLLDEPAGAARWLASVGDQRGVWGSLLVGLGLFNVLRGPITWFFLITVATAAAAQLAEVAASTRQVSRWRSLISGPALPPGTPVDLGYGPSRVRRRMAIAAPADAVTAAVADGLATRFNSVTRGPVESPTADKDQPPGEIRFFCLRNPGALRVRVLLPIGLLLALAGVLLGLFQGWQSTMPLLAPGAVYRDGPRELQIAYPPPTNEQQTAPLIVRIGAIESIIDPTLHRDYRIGPATLRIDAHRPGLWLATADGSALLARPGRGDATKAVGVACGSPGDEDSLLVPAAGAGLRILCGDGAPEFSIELYQSDTDQPVFAADVFPGDRLTIPLSGTQGLDLIAVPALAVSVSSFPQLWLAWLGIIVALAGTSGYLRPTDYALVQVVGLSATHSALIVQSSSAATVQALVDHVTATAATPPSASSLTD